VWLSLSSELAATGRRIAALDAERAALLEARALALSGYAAAGDPRVLARLAVEQGFGPGAPAAPVGVPPESLAGGAMAEVDARSPLAIMRQASAAAADRPGSTAPGDDMPALLMTVGAAAPAYADEIDAPHTAAAGEVR